MTPSSATCWQTFLCWIIWFVSSKCHYLYINLLHVCTGYSLSEIQPIFTGWPICWAYLCIKQDDYKLVITMTSYEGHIARITGHSTVCLRSCADPHQWSIKVRITGPLRGEFTGDGEFPVQRVSNAEKASIWWQHHGWACSINTNPGICSTDFFFIKKSLPAFNDFYKTAQADIIVFFFHKNTAQWYREHRRIILYSLIKLTIKGIFS